MDWLVLLAVQGTLKSLLQHHSSKASILWRSALCGFPGGSEVKTSACNAGNLGREDPLEKEMATHFSILARRTPWTAALQASLFLTISLSLPKFMSIESVMPSNYLILCRPLTFQL